MNDVLLLHATGPDCHALAAFLARRGLRPITVLTADETLKELTRRRAESDSPVVVIAQLEPLAAATAEQLASLRSHSVLVIAAEGAVLPPGFPNSLREPYFLDQLARALDEVLPKGSRPAAPAPPALPVPPASAPPRGGPPTGRDGEFLRGLSHAINNPLTAALGWVRLLEMDLDSDDERRRLVGQIRHEVEAVARISQAMAFLGGRALRQPMAVDLGDLVAAFIQRLAGVAGHVRLGHGRPSGCLAQTDAGALDLMLGLLCAGADERTPVGAIEVSVDSDAGWAQISVRDPQASPVPDLRDFGALLRNSRHGRALGIAVASEIAVRGSGELRCEPAGPSGSTLTLRLPAAFRERTMEAHR